MPQWVEPLQRLAMGCARFSMLCRLVAQLQSESDPGTQTYHRTSRQRNQDTLCQLDVIQEGAVRAGILMETDLEGSLPFRPGTQLNM